MLAGGEIARLWATVGADVSEFLNKMANVERATQSTGARIERMLEGAFSAYALRQAVGYAAELAEVGAQAERLGDAFATLGGADATRMLERMRQAAQGTISDMDLMAAANKAMMLGVTQSADEMGRLVEVAAARGHAMGLSTSQAFSDIVTGIGRMSPMILDNLGILTGGQAAFDAYAASIGKAADKLSDAEKRQALLNKVLNDGATAALQTAGANEQAASSLERLSAGWENLRVAEGKRLATGAAPAAGALGGMLSGWAESIEESSAAFAEWARAQDEVTKLADRNIPKLADLAQAVWNLRPGVGSSIQDAEDFRRAYDAIAAREPGWAAALNDLRREEQAIADLRAANLDQPGHLAGVELQPAPMRGQSVNVRPDLYGRPIVGPSAEELASAQWAIDQLQREQERFDRLQEQAARDREAAAERAQREWEAQQREWQAQLRSTVEGVLSPTSVTASDIWQTQTGAYAGRWDEYIRRLRSAVQDPNSAWKGLVPTDVLGGGQAAMRGWFEQQSAAFYAGQLPEQIDWAAFDRQVQDAIAKQQAREALIQQAMARSGGALGKAQAAAMLGLPYNPGEAVAGDVAKGLAETDYGKPLANALEEQIQAESEHLHAVGRTLGLYVLGGAKSAMTPQVGRDLARALWPYIADLLPQERP